MPTATQRRGLAATLLAGFLPPPGPALRTAAACIHLAAIVLLLGLLLTILSRWRAPGAGLVALAAAPFATSASAASILVTRTA